MDKDGDGQDSGSGTGRPSRRLSYGSADIPTRRSRTATDSPTQSSSGNRPKQMISLSPLSIGTDSVPSSTGTCIIGETAADSWINDEDVQSSWCSRQRQQPASRLSDGKMRLLFGVMGTGTLFPYNAIITCVDYYAELHPEVGDVAGELAASCLTALLLATVLLLPLSTPTSTDADTASSNSNAAGMPRTCSSCFGYGWNYFTAMFAFPIRRVYIGFGLCLLSLLLLAALQQPSMQLLNVSAFLVGVADATSQSGLYVYAAFFHRPQYTAAVTFGSAIEGLAVGLLRLVTRGIFDTSTLDGLRTGVSLLYVISSGVIAMCIWALRRVVRENHINGDAVEERPQCTASSSDTDTGLTSRIAPRSCWCQIVHHPRFEVYLETIKVTWKPQLAAFLNFFVTLSLFPGTISSIESIPSNAGGMSFHLGDWLPIVLITTFNAADCVGRGVLNIEWLGLSRLLLSKRDLVRAAADGDDAASSRTTEGRILLPNLDKLVWYRCFARIMIYPLLALCILPTMPHPVISMDLLRILIVFLFGFSNGFVNCAAFMVSPTMVKKEMHRDASSLLMLLSIYSGLTLGSYFGLLVDLVIRTLGGE